MAKVRKPAPDVPQLQARLVPIDSVRPDPNNAREHNERSIAALVENLKDFKQQKPIVVDRDGVIRAGNGTWLAAKKIGWRHINVIQTDLDAEAAARYAIADNRSGELSYFDESRLAVSLRDADAQQLAAMGFDEAERQALIDAAELMPQPSTPGKKSQGQITTKTAVRLMVVVANVEIVERALQATGKMNREQALLDVCQSYLSTTGQFGAG